MAVAAETSLIVYDGECIYCQNYVRFVRLKQAIGPVELIDARSDDQRVREFWKAGYDLNEGMLFLYCGKVYHGAEAVFMLASLSSRNSALNRINARLFGDRRAASLLYPILKLGRRLTLFARGKTGLKKP